MKIEELAMLIHFRQELYDSLGLRQDSLFELVDAALTAAHRSTLVRLSLTAAFRRLWPSTCDALADGSVDVSALRTLCTRTLSDSAIIDERPLCVIDGTTGHAQRHARAPIGPGSIGRCQAGRKAGSCPPGPINGWWP